LADLAALIHLGIIFPEFKEAKMWRELGIKELVAESKKQIHSEGVDFEGSIAYNRFVLELFLSCAVLSKINEIHFPRDFWSQLEIMFEFIAHYLKPDGTAPRIGDDAGDARLLFLSNTSNCTNSSSNDHRYLLSLGATLFKREDFGELINGEIFEESVWFLNKLL